MNKSLDEIQKEIGAWSKEQFGENLSKDRNAVSYGHPLGSIPPLFGMMGELGELVQVVIRLHQGRIKGTQVDAFNDMADAMADLMVFMCDFASREGINLQCVLNMVWAKVQKRRQETWEKDKAKEQVVEQDGHGFGHHPNTPT